MEKEEKVKELREGGQLIGEKLKRGVLIGKRQGNSTPSPTWKFGLIQPDGSLIPDFNLSSNSNAISARKLGANLWEMFPQSNPSLAKLKKIGPIFGHKKGENISSEELKDKPAENHAEQPATGTNIGEQVAASPTPYNLRVEKVAQAQPPLSPASYCSSMEMPPYRPAISPSSALFSKGKLVESSHSPRTSTELLKLLNRIWSLEEKHALDMSLVKMLRRELDQSQAQIQELLQQKKIDQTEINSLMKRLSEYKVAMKKEKDRFRDAVKVVEDKVEDEHKLRRNSERLNHKLDKELFDLKSLLSNALRELERERKARTLLEDLCNEFAKGIRDYEHEVRSMKHNYCKDRIGRESDDRLILHISEAWLDQQSQMKLSDSCVSEKQSNLDKLCFEIEGFLQAKQSGQNDYVPTKYPHESSTLVPSFESFHLNEPASAPWKANDGDDSVTAKSKIGKKKLRSRKDSDPSTSLLLPQDEPVNEDEESTRSRTDTSSKMPKGKNRITDTAIDLHDTTAATTINPSLSSDVKNLRYRIKDSFDPSMFTGIKSGSLKAKLMEARIEGQQSRPRTSRGSPD